MRITHVLSHTTFAPTLHQLATQLDRQDYDKSITHTSFGQLHDATLTHLGAEAAPPTAGVGSQVRVRCHNRLAFTLGRGSVVVVWCMG